MGRERERERVRVERMEGGGKGERGRGRKGGTEEETWSNRQREGGVEEMRDRRVKQGLAETQRLQPYTILLCIHLLIAFHYGECGNGMALYWPRSDNNVDNYVIHCGGSLVVSHGVEFIVSVFPFHKRSPK